MTDTTSEPRQVRLEDTIQHYVDFWNAEFAGDQRRLGAAAFEDTPEYHAPIGVMRGIEDLMAFRNEFAANMGPVEFRLRAEPELLEDRARVRWEILVGEASFSEGTDVLLFGPNRRIDSVSAFLDRAPEGFDPHLHDEPVRSEGRW